MPRDSQARERQARALARKKPRRPLFDRVLIVTEGTKTEPNYFEAIRTQVRAASAHIAVVPSASGTEPAQVVDFAHDLFLRKDRGFEWIFAVFDRDDHSTYANALLRARQLDNTLRSDEKRVVRFLAVPSVPCFELWLLIHFEDVWAPRHRDEVLTRLKRFLPGYHKGSADTYEKTESRLDGAISRAKQLRQRYEPDKGTDPYTNVDEVVERLRSIKGLN